MKEPKPEICTLDFNTMVNKTWTVINTPPTLKVMADIANEARTKPEIEIFDSSDLIMAKNYIIVGAGSSGCVLANRLSENPNHNVLLIEAGGRDLSVDPRACRLFQDHEKPQLRLVLQDRADPGIEAQWADGDWGQHGGRLPPDVAG